MKKRGIRLLVHFIITMAAVYLASTLGEKFIHSNADNKIVKDSVEVAFLNKESTQGYDITNCLVVLSYKKSEYFGNTVKIDVSVSAYEEYAVNKVKLFLHSDEFEIKPENNLDFGPDDSKPFLLTPKSTGNKLIIVNVEMFRKDSWVPIGGTSEVMEVGIQINEKTEIESVFSIIKNASAAIGLPALIVLFVTRYLDRKKKEREKKN